MPGLPNSRSFATKPSASSKPGASKKPKKSADLDESSSRVKPLLTLLRSPERKELPMTPEEEAMSQRYATARVEEHHAWMHDMTVKHKLQQAALRALPERLREAAMQPDLTPFPLNRKFYFDTPPESYRDPMVAAAAGSADSAASGGSEGARQGAAGGKAAAK